MTKETMKKIIEHLRSTEAHLDQLIAIFQARIERNQSRERREAS